MTSRGFPTEPLPPLSPRQRLDSRNNRPQQGSLRPLHLPVRLPQTRVPDQAELPAREWRLASDRDPPAEHSLGLRFSLLF